VHPRQGITANSQGQNNFADVSQAVGAIFDTLSDGLRTYVQGRLEAIPEDEDFQDSDSELPGILFDGTFAEPTPDLGDLFEDELTSVVGSFMIK
jgi:hypothetical protein